MPSVFGDNMVLQVGKRTPIYGKAAPREIVTIKVGDDQAVAMANDRGEWRVEFDFPKTAGPLDVQVNGGNDQITFHNVLIGEVWICSGQSNMEWSYHSAKKANQSVSIGNPERPKLRLFKVKHKVSLIPLQDVEGQWMECTSSSMNDFSLLGYLFGANLQDRLNCGIGVIQSDWGGTPAESWTPHATLDNNPELRSLISGNFPVPVGAGENSDKHRPERAATVLYNGMIAPLMDFGFRGVAWYQGESNVGRADQYRTLFPALIEGWRKDAKRTFPFLYVQLASFEPRPPDGPNQDWAELREAQLTALNLPKTGMASAVDLSNPSEIHWLRREELARRLTWIAMNQSYGQKTPVTGPRYMRHSVSNGQMRVEFTSKLNGLMMRSSNGLCGFEIAGADGVYYPAQARIDRGTVILSTVKVPTPVYVRYGWANAPALSIYNTAGLPAIPFRAGGQK